MEKYDLTGIDGNAYAIMGYVARCMREEHCTKKEIDEYFADAQSGDYEDLVWTSFAMIEKLNEKAASGI